MVPVSMRVSKYVPARLYGFTMDQDSGQQAFFHLGAFQPGSGWMEHRRCRECPRQGCSWVNPPPPILGELVRVEVNLDSGEVGQAPKATRVERITAPIAIEGIVEAFDVSRAFGFAMGDDNIAYHLHKSELLEDRIPIVGHKVMFFAGTRQGRPRACHVKVCP